MKQALPTLNVHPTDFNTPICDGKTQLAVLKIARPFESWTVAALINLTDAERERVITVSDTLRLADGKYLVYDYFADELLGEMTDSMILKVKPYDTKLISVRAVTGKPQLLSTSRHFSQGAAEITNVDWSEAELTMTVSADLISEEEYRLAIYVPNGYTATSCTVGYVDQSGNLLRVSAVPPTTGNYDFVITFKKTN